MKIYVARHGQTIWNTEHRMQGWQDSNLSPKGIEDAKKLGESLKNISFDAIFSSPLGRAYNTAEYVKGERKNEIVTLDSFKEMNFGAWEGMKDSEVTEKYPKEHHHFWIQPELFTPIQGESFPELITRVDKGLKELIKECRDSRNCNENRDNILLVTHTCVIKSMLSIIKKLGIKDFWNPPFIYATSLTVIRVEDEAMETILEADTSHLL